jgi:hypothetical protein
LIESFLSTFCSVACILGIIFKNPL